MRKVIYTDEFGAQGNNFSFEYCYSHSFFPIWSLSCKGWGLLFQLNIMGDKIICKDSSDATVFKLQCYSGRKILNQHRLAQLIKKSKLAALHTYTERTSENQCRIYWLFLLLSLLFANSTTIFLPFFITSSFISPSHNSPRGSTLSLLVSSCLVVIFHHLLASGKRKVRGEALRQHSDWAFLTENCILRLSSYVRYQIQFFNFSFTF